ncbi:DNA helicase-2/ATP-dependent DNA helicase PcrA [Rhizobium sp. BK077]|uniref:UvrD-helicase domain-containing protein n=1 Tax=unclassified Rhizobium TaxID=2613769 RepID=UPI00161DE3EA|nr:MULTISPECIES: UvrD-helicase domain-containing protein [unclassified Rhizobium]MBB3302971.1 DNA helicase-2/ATP-dependent DNA helicase PcrA [Rhizobium sp. BK112]MBB3371864.1 DNA helicase-2/ATP-dependent DNA helicase PcrA [Rhizobium sp. BK077]MBB4182831.1 DNA helicase-2/ATP-dependent DNA helicase PcrA [Rhizobium sp. BK109]
MADDQEISRLAAGIRRGSIVAAAGCGKTEQIALAVAISSRRRLILTHTHAGVDAITRRMKKYRVSNDKYRVDTIAGWCLRFAASFPQRSGITATVPTTAAEWDGVYSAGARLLDSGAVDGVLIASYGGCFVDEYQDCTVQQHQVVERLANLLPTCVFGDPMQAIFDFRNQQPVDWITDVFPTFARTAELLTPWRWKKENNEELAEWLGAVRAGLERNNQVDLSSRPKCVTWKALPADAKLHQKTVVGQCLEAMDENDLGNLIVIGDSVSENRRSALGKKLAKQGFSNIEAVSCKTLHSAARALDATTGVARLKLLLNFAAKCMTGAEKAELNRVIDARQQGRRRGQTKFGFLFPAIDDVVATGGELAMLAFLQGMRDRPDARLYRREMFYAMRGALQNKAARQLATLSDSVWEVQNRVRHAGRRLGDRSIGSTLLVKGLEFDRAIIVSSETMTNRDWYVALTRATKTMRIISISEKFTTN